MIWFSIISFLIYLGNVKFFEKPIFYDFFSFSNMFIFLKVYLIIYPIYLLIFFCNKKHIKWYDYFLFYYPIFFWFFLSLFLSGKTLANLVIDIPIMWLLSGLYLFKFPIVKKQRYDHSLLTTFMIIAVFSVLITILYIVIPPIPE